MAILTSLFKSISYSILAGFQKRLVEGGVLAAFAQILVSIETDVCLYVDRYVIN